MPKPQTVVLDETLKQCGGCPAVGRPEPGDNFYLCLACQDTLGKLMAACEAQTAHAQRSGLVS